MFPLRVGPRDSPGSPPTVPGVPATPILGRSGSAWSRRLPGRNRTTSTSTSPASQALSASLGHEVTVLAPSTRGGDLLAGRRALAKREHADVIAVGPAIPISRRSQMGVPVGVRANLSLALAQGEFDVVHGFEPGLPVALVPRAPRRRRARGRDVRLAEPARLPARPLAAREAARPARRAARAERDRARGGRGAVPGRLSPRLSRRRHDALRPRREDEDDRRRVAPQRASRRARRAARGYATCPAGRSSCSARAR